MTIIYRILFLIVLLVCMDQLHAQRVSNQLNESYAADPEGYLADRLSGSYRNRILAQDVDRLVEPFRHRTESRCWQTEFWGKWFTSAVSAYRYQPGPELESKLREAVEKLVATQDKEGYIGNYAAEHRLEQWDIWGRKYVLLGLLDYYKIKKDKKVLNVARRVADHFMKELNEADGTIVTKGNYRGMAASSILEPMVALYRSTGEKKYLDFAERIVAQWEMDSGPQLISRSGIDVALRFPKPESWYSWEQGQKAYEMMSCYEGLLDLYRETGKQEYLNAAEKTWENINETEINVVGSGAAAEMWFGGKQYQTHPIHHYQETCVTVTWIKFSHHLLRLTGNAKYADAVEKAYYNALLGSMSAEGAKWAKYTPLAGERLPGSEQCGMGMNCCDASGPRALFNLPSHIVMPGQEGLSVNYFIPGVYQVKAAPVPVKITQQTDYPINGKILVLIDPKKPAAFTLSLRIPEWSEHAKLLINGQPADAVRENGYMKLKRTWKVGDQVELELDMRAKVLQNEKQGHFFAVRRGPIVLTRDSSLPGPPLQASLTPLLNPDGSVRVSLAPAPGSQSWVSCKVTFQPEAYTETAAEPVELDMIDYASAGYTTTSSAFLVWMPKLINPQRL